jgi:hypothetical protein
MIDERYGTVSPPGFFFSHSVPKWWPGVNSRLNSDKVGKRQEQHSKVTSLQIFAAGPQLAQTANRRDVVVLTQVARRSERHVHLGPGLRAGRFGRLRFTYTTHYILIVYPMYTHEDYTSSFHFLYSTVSESSVDDDARSRLIGQDEF